MFRGPPPDLSRYHSILVNNLTEDTTPDDLNALFKGYGEVGDVYIPRDRNSRSGYKTFGFVRFVEKAHADAALEADGTELHGNKIGVQEAKYGRRDRDRDRGRDDRDRGSDGRDRYDNRDRYDDRDRYYDDRDRYDDRRGGRAGGYDDRDNHRRDYSRSRSPRYRDRSPGRY
ncbi:RRM domain-containing protein [Plasmodiophora brassicae]|uniref:RRM domain-containing protein n=1 Tax=Plasmodiophora brassicae TaxID=37360 RepID=A0A0G4IZM9_PLABS|nr:hypothetical protein PBRA_001580 [Plasmodiophora brassicae]SPQ93975.1 unnamed protein product [Plasmodiophora brassicae]